MLLQEIHLKNFRCFSDSVIQLGAPLILIEGLNGSGKTSLLEALHYMCYLRSFRTGTPRDLLAQGHDAFFVKLFFNETASGNPSELQIGFSGKKKLVKINQRSVNSYKELVQHYRVVTLTEDDLMLISGTPEVRRLFIDQARLVDNPDSVSQMRSLRAIVQQRNSLLRSGGLDQHLYDVWTEQLWMISETIVQDRTVYLKALQQEAQQLIKQYFKEDISITCTYRPKRIEGYDWQEFKHNRPLMAEELRAGYSLFGAHLDDILIQFQDKKSKTFASRGQQKLILVLLKIAQIKKLLLQHGSLTFLLDDFMTDFDERRITTFVDILADLNIQLIFTCPTPARFLGELLEKRGAFKIILTH